MNEGRSIERRIQRYLDEIKVHLRDLSEEEIDEVLDSVRSHVHNELQSWSEGPPTLEDLEQVLQKMDPPGAYAKNIFHTTKDFSPQKRITRYAILGAALLPFGLGIALIFFPIFPAGLDRIPTFGHWILRFTILPLGILAPFASTALGLMGISEIRNSEGEVIGMPLAFSVGIFYPIIAIDVVLFVITMMIFSGEDNSNTIIEVFLIAALTIDYFVLRSAWRIANRKDEDIDIEPLQH